MTLQEIESVLLALSKWEVDGNGWSFQVGQTGGGMGYTDKHEAARECAELIFQALPSAA